MELEEMIEKTLPSGEVITFAKDGFYVVDCWDKNGDNRWSKMFRDYELAKAEYDRWN